MPLYDCMLLVKLTVAKESLIDLVARVGKHVYSKNGVVTEVRSFGTIQLGYGIKKLDGRHYQGRLMQMTLMTPPSFHKELRYLNKEDRLLRWLFIKHRDIKLGMEYLNEDDTKGDLSRFKSNLFDEDSTEEDEDDDDDDENLVADQEEEIKG